MGGSNSRDLKEKVLGSKSQVNLNLSLNLNKKHKTDQTDYKCASKSP